jgi:hypothetical protein
MRHDCTLYLEIGFDSKPYLREILPLLQKTPPSLLQEIGRVLFATRLMATLLMKGSQKFAYTAGDDRKSGSDLQVKDYFLFSSSKAFPASPLANCLAWTSPPRGFRNSAVVGGERERHS